MAFDHQALRMKQKLAEMEVDGRYAADFRRLARNARCRIVACETSGDAESVRAAVSKASELLSMWNGYAGAPTL